ncbi:acetyl-CoA carboxylase biotin carboxylase subunit [Palleronia caenipelagi]|uniref:Acetyl/propionyl/methylcrotonyl-CoA carboxylase subunit alpha n=1 Tax=Palleronia caenipelagi TaxID=2489174 RepID=A0A547Q8F9_9RHOB|nr:acetyl/propionyl/methylcrotonyl-CoA carboxylase subunit alpha [Palleronia caenipelagi]TRD22659.1 acetyl/propionyl/methylcrotonyl-CoA carboxylase subunit alpha [Palleronia caenipelagi]
MFRKLLIANRGEIACRVIATARRMGIFTVAVYSDADREARHVAMADEAVRIGPAPVTESYLRAEAILDAARITGADAIHPGYGFLSENPEFVEAAEAAGLIFVGPPPSAIRAMGLKDAAKALMERAGVPVVPGYHNADQDADRLAAEADRIGYPVLIKARAGGGGKGMRLVERPEDFADALSGAQREGQASFGDPGVLVEKFVTCPRHVEIQIFADRQGNVVHLFERDCSLQRRHQKVIEEAPAPHMPEEVRAAMGQAAVEAARAIGYVGAGTVEFIADGSGPLRPDGFWFMEMNTRLQVEHPVTEAITGQDLVALQLQVAAGTPLPFEQEDLRIDGHAFEARLYAEDVSAGFLPATGRLAHLRFPEGAEFGPAAVRIDAGVRAGDEITPHYDPMIAKIITHGPDRATALARLTRALEQTEVAGLVTNRAFLTALTRNQGFASGEVDTGLIARDLEALTAPSEMDPVLHAVLAVAVLGFLDEVSDADPWTALTGWRAWGPAVQTARYVFDGTEQAVAVETLAPGRFIVNGVRLNLSRDGDRFRVISEGRSRTVACVKDDDRFKIIGDGHALTAQRLDPLAVGGTTEAGGDVILAPMPGKVIALHVAAGDLVTAKQPLLVLEAMKMEHTLTAPRDGTVAELLAAPGDQVENGALLIRLEAEDG